MDNDRIYSLIIIIIARILAMSIFQNVKSESPNHIFVILHLNLKPQCPT
jgi:hypothetical protein